MENKELIQKIYNVLNNVLPSNTVITVWEYSLLGKHIGIKFHPQAETIHNVSGQYPQIVSLSLDLQDFELYPQMFGGNGGQFIYREINPDDPKEKYLAMKSIKIPFRKPKPEEKFILNAIERFAKNWLKALNDNIHVLRYKDMVNYEEFLNS